MTLPRTPSSDRQRPRRSLAEAREPRGRAPVRGDGAGVGPPSGTGQTELFGEG